MPELSAPSAYPPVPPSPRPARKWTEWVAVLALLFSLAAAGLSGAILWLVWPREEPIPPEEPPPVTVEDETAYISYRDRQLPVQEGVPINQYDKSAFSVDDRGWITYEAEGVSAIPGIDVSAYQKEIDWPQVARAGIRFAMIRVGYRGYGESGVILHDNYYQQNLQGALDAGLEVGVYFFSQATTVWEAEEEATFLLESIADYDITYPVVFDWEYITGNRKSRTQAVTGAAITRMAGAFCDLVAEAGYQPAVYFNQDTAYLHLDLATLVEYPFWLAEYNARPGFYYNFFMWQYTDKATVPGIEGKTDLNLAFWQENDAGRPTP